MVEVLAGVGVPLDGGSANGAILMRSTFGPCHDTVLTKDVTTMKSNRSHKRIVADTALGFTLFH